MVALDWKKATLPFNNLIQPSWLKKLPALVSFFLFIAIAYSLAMLTWMLLPTVDQARYVDSGRAVSAAGTVSSDRSGAASIPDIARLHLFGEVSKVVAPPQPEQEVVPETKLRLELKGIWASSDPKLARAIVSEPPRNENTYAVGAALPGGATLVEIHADHIVLSRGGRKEKLLLPREVLQSGNSSRGTSSRNSSNNRRGVSSRSSPRSQSSTVSSRAAEGLATISRLSQVREALNNDPQSLMGLADVRPEIKNGQVVGYKLNGMQNEQLMRRFGLRRGDVITAVNGVGLDGATNLLSLFNELKTAEQVKVEYKRRGRPRSVVLNMNE